MTEMLLRGRSWITGGRTLRQRGENGVSISRLTLSVVTVLGCLSLAAAGCGGDDDDDSNGGGDGGNSSAQSGSTDFSGSQVTFAGFGGVTQDNINKVVLEPFGEETGAEIVNDTMDYAKVVSMVDAGNVTWDVVNSDGYFAEQQCDDGKAEPLTDVVMTAIEEAQLPEGSYGRCHIEPWSYSSVLSYRTDLPRAPESWADFFDSEGLPGKRTLWSGDQVAQLEAGAVAAGAPTSDPYPIDIQTSLDQFDGIRDDIVFTDSFSQQTQQLVSGAVTMGITPHSRTLEAKNAGEPVDVLWDGQVVVGDAFWVPKDAPNTDVAMAALASFLDTDRLIEFAKVHKYGPNGEVAREGISDLPECPEINTCGDKLDNAIQVNDTWWKDNREKITAEWEQWLSE